MKAGIVDFIGMSGAAMSIAGIAMIYPPAALIVAGVMAMTWAVLASRKFAGPSKGGDQ